MKKLILLLSAVPFVFAACTSDADPLPSPTPIVDVNSVLVKKTIYTEAGSPTETTNYIYNGFKLVKITDDFGYSNITYTGDLITLVQTYDDTNHLQASEQYTYNGSNKLTSYIYKDHDIDYGTKETYVYNVDGTISVSKYAGDTAAQTDYYGYYKMFFLNREVVKLENYDSLGILAETSTFTYDGKNNPFKNIIGWPQLQYSSSQLGGAYQNVLHNNDPNEDLTNTYTYDSNNYPLTQTERDNTNTIVGNTKYFY